MKFQWRQEKPQPESLHHFLKRHQVSQRLLQRIKHVGQVQVNQKVQPMDHELQIQDLITVSLPDEVADPEIQVSQQPVNVLYEDTNWLVANKPADLSSVPGPTNSTDTLVNRLKGYLIRTHQPGVLHPVNRLDRFTSGVVLFAKNQVAHSLISDQVNQHRLEKIYLAVVSGQLLPATGELNFPIARVADSPRRIVADNGQKARTDYTVLQTFSTATLVRVHLITGRTHQIRVHFTQIAHPLLGDDLYGGPLDRGIARQALHASQITFLDPFSENKIHIEAPLPRDFAKLLTQLETDTELHENKLS